MSARGCKELHRGRVILVGGRTYWREIISVVKERVYGLDNRADVGFRADATDPDLSGFLSQLVGEMNCDHEDGNFRKELRNLPGNVNPVYIWHLEVQQDHIRRMFLNSL
jgi:hypothetical protein